MLNFIRRYIYLLLKERVMSKSLRANRWCSLHLWVCDPEQQQQQQSSVRALCPITRYRGFSALVHVTVVITTSCRRGGCLT